MLCRARVASVTSLLAHLGSLHEASLKQTVGELELDPSYVNCATNLQKCLNIRLVMVSVNLFSCFLGPTLKKKKKSAEMETIIKIIELFELE